MFYLAELFETTDNVIGLKGYIVLRIVHKHCGKIGVLKKVILERCYRYRWFLHPVIASAYLTRLEKRELIKPTKNGDEISYIITDEGLLWMKEDAKWLLLWKLFVMVGLFAAFIAAIYSALTYYKS